MPQGGLGPVRTGAIALIAAAGVGFVAYQTWAVFRPRPPRVRSMRPPMNQPADETVRGAAAQLPTLDGSFEFQPVGSADERASAGRALAASWTDQSQAADSRLGRLEARSLADGAVELVEPLLAGSADDWFALVDARGGTQPAPDSPIRGIIVGIAQEIGLGEVDASQATVTAVTTGPDADRIGPPGSVSVGQFDDNSVQTTVLEVRPPGVFAQLDDFPSKGRQAVEVRVPVRAAGSSAAGPTMHLGLVLAYEGGEWLPVTIKLYLHDEASAGRVMAAIQQASRGGG